MPDDLKELAALLGVTDADFDSDTVKPDVIEEAGGEAPKRVSDTVFEIDAWGMRKGRELIQKEHGNERLDKLELDEYEAADMYGMSFQPFPKMEEHPRDEVRKAFCKQVMETPEFLSIHHATMLNDVASEIAATAYAEQFIALRKEEKKEEDRCDRKGIPYPGVSADKVLGAAAKALSAAKEEVDACKDVAGALGIGEGPAGGRIDPKRLMEALKRINRSPKLKRIMDHTGKFIMVAQSKQRTKASHGVDEMVGVVPGSDIARLLPVELCKLNDPAFEDDTLRRIIEGQAQCWELQGVIPAGKGPIIVVIDESGSMSGDPVETAKALALSMAYIARRQRRWFMLVAFSGDTGVRKLTVPNGQFDDLAMLDWLEQFIGGGSSRDVPLVELPQYYKDSGAPKGKTDVLMITDAICSVGADLCKTFNGWKESASCKVTTMIIGQKTAGDLTKISDQVFLVPSIQADSAAVEAAVSI